MTATVEDLTQREPNEPPEHQREMLPPPSQDGRTLRRLNSFDRAVDALLDLIESGHSSPTAQQIAEKSGISVRTVFRLTEDIEQLHAAAIERQIQRTAHLYVQIPATGSLSTRIRALVENRSTVFETIAPARRVAERLAESSPQITQGLAFHHDILQMQVAELFDRELSRISRVRRADALSAIDVAASWETWDHLRRIQGLSIMSSGRVVRQLIEGVLAK